MGIPEVPERKRITGRKILKVAALGVGFGAALIGADQAAKELYEKKKNTIVEQSVGHQYEKEMPQATGPEDEKIIEQSEPANQGD